MQLIKVTIKGSVYSFDLAYSPMSEAITIEENLGMPFHKWRTDLSLGTAKALAGLVWLVLHRDGQDVKLADIISGAYELTDQDVDIAPEGGPDPTEVPSPPTGESTSEPSPSTSGSVPGSGD